MQGLNFIKTSFIPESRYFCRLCISGLRVNIYFIQHSFGSCCFTAWETNLQTNPSEWFEWFTLNHKLTETLLTNSIHCKEVIHSQNGHHCFFILNNRQNIFNIIVEVVFASGTLLINFYLKLRDFSNATAQHCCLSQCSCLAFSHF